MSSNIPKARKRIEMLAEKLLGLSKMQTEIATEMIQMMPMLTKSSNRGKREDGPSDDDVFGPAVIQ